MAASFFSSQLYDATYSQFSTPSLMAGDAAVSCLSVMAFSCFCVDNGGGRYGFETASNFRSQGREPVDLEALLPSHGE
jgi:hypothetical protein